MHHNIDARLRRCIVPSLFNAARSVPTVDTHQHLGPETPITTDLAQLMVNDNYLATDLVSAGMSQQTREKIADAALPLLQRWDVLAPFWKNVQHGSYAQAHWITLRDLYNAKTLARSEIEEVSARLSSDYVAPGLFERIFCERCHIDIVLTQGFYFHHSKPFIATVGRPCLDRMDFSKGGLFDTDAKEAGITVSSAEDLIPAMDAIIRQHHAQGAVGFKIAAVSWHPPTPEEIKTAFNQCRTAKPGALFPLDRITHTPVFPLYCLWISRVATLAEELNVPVAIHTGAPWSNWLDFRIWEPTGLIPLLNTFRETRFDLYHAGIPYGTPFSMLGKTYPNVWLNLSWAHIISSELVLRSINEWLDLVPINKVIGFGGDYHNRAVVLTYGHYIMACRHLAQVLAGRVQHRQITDTHARAILQAWLSDNPRQLYRLDPSLRPPAQVGYSPKTLTVRVLSR